MVYSRGLGAVLDQMDGGQATRVTQRMAGIAMIAVAAAVDVVSVPCDDAIKHAHATGMRHQRLNPGARQSRHRTSSPRLPCPDCATTCGPPAPASAANSDRPRALGLHSRKCSSSGSAMDVTGAATIPGRDKQASAPAGCVDNSSANAIESWISRQACCSRPLPTASKRSEEHTSELQSRGHLVCRLLLEKKK